MMPFLIFFLSRKFLPTPNHGVNYLDKLHFKYLSLIQNPRLRNRYICLILKLPFQNWTTTRSDNFPLKHHYDKTHSEYYQNIYSFPNGSLCFLLQSRCKLCPPSPLLCSTCLISLLNMFWAISKSYTLCKFWKKLPNSKKKHQVVFDFW